MAETVGDSPLGEGNVQRESSSTEGAHDPTPQHEKDLKLRILDLALPAESAVVFGDVWRVEGAYARWCAESGCRRVLVVDSLETPGWLGRRQALPVLDFRKGDFADPFFMAAIRERFDISVAFNVLLHQPPLLSALHLMLEKTERAICIVQPMLKERDLPNSLVYLPGNQAVDQLAPAPSADVQAFAVEEVNHSHWIWGMTQSFLGNALAGEGFEVTQEETGESLPNANWFWYGCIAERREPNPHHWSGLQPGPVIHEPGV